MKNMLERKSGNLRYYVYPSTINSYHMTNVTSVKAWLEGMIHPDYVLIYEHSLDDDYFDVYIKNKNDQSEDNKEHLFCWTIGNKDYISLPISRCRPDLI